ncbi:hypothetical protein [Luteimonas sp. MC1750]|uniref:hypothetical protein n=1 Tax=Luteimonas sp. MC1750 TaxID=2799326 RepID=UPI0018F07B7B|nr:hypothetical protein [Luteimonas sp. MC1750]MBJ6984204.1 hypothetical protein [Luteimonas sp. MC1750]QQO07009.1 hypothetical protein JGR68_06220 [Luteimonas sp. MC1750]
MDMTNGTARTSGVCRLHHVLAATCLLAACANVGATAADAVATYPDSLHGHWMPRDLDCSVPINYDSDSLVVIDATGLGQYENANKPVNVRQVAAKPRAWVIESLLNISGDGDDTSVTEIFGLREPDY